MQNNTTDIKNNFYWNGQVNQNPQLYPTNTLEVPPNTQVLSPHLAQVINEQYLMPQHIPANQNNQTATYPINQFQTPLNPQPTPRIDEVDTRNVELRTRYNLQFNSN